MLFFDRIHSCPVAFASAADPEPLLAQRGHVAADSVFLPAGRRAEFREARAAGALEERDHRGLVRALALHASRRCVRTRVGRLRRLLGALCGPCSLCRLQLSQDAFPKRLPACRDNLNRRTGQPNYWLWTRAGEPRRLQQPVCETLPRRRLVLQQVGFAHGSAGRNGGHAGRSQVPCARPTGVKLV